MTGFWIGFRHSVWGEELSERITFSLVNGLVLALNA
jgi:hypothetical protein